MARSGRHPIRGGHFGAWGHAELRRATLIIFYPRAAEDAAGAGIPEACTGHFPVMHEA